MTSQTPRTPEPTFEIGCPHGAWGMVVPCPQCGSPRHVSPNDYVTARFLKEVEAGERDWPEAEAAALPASPDVVERQRLNDEYMRGYRAASRMRDSLLALERAAVEPILGALRYPCREPIHQQAAKALDAMDEQVALPAADKPEPSVQAQPAGLASGERLYRAWWSIAWQEGSNPNQWEQLAPAKQESWNRVAAAYAGGKPRP